MGRYCKTELAVPDRIIAKIVETPPDQIYKLSAADLAEMRVEELPPPDEPAQPAQDDMYSNGLADRTDWENWISVLTGSYRTGAEFWAGQRSLSKPGSCASNYPAFTAGCEAAKAKLAPSDALRRSNARYRLGWNAYGH